MSNKIKDNYRVVDYTHIDDYRCFHPLANVVEYFEFDSLTPEQKRQHVEELRAELTVLFRQSGWEGDGAIECYFVPPCFGNHGDDGGTHCIAIYHVKQSNNGTSWLAIPNGFEFRLPEGWLTKRVHSVSNN